MRPIGRLPCPGGLENLSFRSSTLYLNVFLEEPQRDTHCKGAALVRVRAKLVENALGDLTFALMGTLFRAKVAFKQKHVFRRP